MFTGARPLLSYQHMITDGFYSQLHSRSFTQSSASCFTLVNQDSSRKLSTNYGCKH